MSTGGWDVVPQATVQQVSDSISRALYDLPKWRPAKVFRAVIVIKVPATPRSSSFDGRAGDVAPGSTGHWRPGRAGMATICLLEVLPIGN